MGQAFHRLGSAAAYHRIRVPLPLRVSGPGMTRCIDFDPNPRFRFFVVIPDARSAIRIGSALNV